MKKLTILTLVLAVGMFFAAGIGNANAANSWYFTITNAGDLVEGQTFWAEIHFVGADNGDPNVGNDGKNNLNVYGLDLDYNLELLQYERCCYVDHYVPDWSYMLFNGGFMTPPIEDPPGYLYDFMGAENLDHQREFYPDDAPNPYSNCGPGCPPCPNRPFYHLANVEFTAKVTGHYDDLGMVWSAPDKDCLAKVDWVVYDKADNFSAWTDGDLAKASWQYLETEYWVGDGSNKAFLIVDFGDESFAFGYRWEGEKTVSDMLVAFDEFYEDSDNLWIQFIQGPSSPVRGLNYKGIRLEPTAGFESQDEGKNWTSIWVPTAVPLINGSWIGYSPLFPKPPAPPDIPAP